MNPIMRQEFNKIYKELAEIKAMVGKLSKPKPVVKPKLTAKKTKK